MHTLIENMYSYTIYSLQPDIFKAPLAMIFLKLFTLALQHWDIYILGNTNLITWMAIPPMHNKFSLQKKPCFFRRVSTYGQHLMQPLYFITKSTRKFSKIYLFIILKYPLGKMKIFSSSSKWFNLHSLTLKW